MSVDLQNEELHTVLRTIAQQGTIDIRHLEGVPNPRLSLRFSALPVVAGLQRLLRAAEVTSYVLVTTTHNNRVQVKRIQFFVTTESQQTQRAHTARALSAPASRQSAPSPPAEKQEESEPSTASVFEELKTNTAARRLLSQLIHPNEQVRDRALERLIRLIDNDDKQAELLEFLDPLLEDLGSENREEREEARQEIRKLLRR